VKLARVSTMKRVWSGSTLHDTAHLQNLLEQAGIGCFIKHRELASAMGDLPFLECSPELWVLRDEQAVSATAVIREALRPDTGAPVARWRCAECGEDNEAQFAACWRCGQRDAAAPE
jgi:hypothetical protein